MSGAVASAICGRLGDMYDRKCMLLIVIAVAIVGAFTAATSPTLTGVIVGRSLEGITGAIMPLCVGILRQHIDSRALPMYIGILTAMASVSAGQGMLAGGIIVDLLNWRWIFYSIVIVGVLAWLSVYWILPISSSDQRQKGTNFFGGILFAPGLVFLMVALTQGQGWGWTSWMTLSLLVAGVALTMAWCRSELRAEVPLLNIRLAFNREIMFAYMAAAWIAAMIKHDTIPFIVLLLLAMGVSSSFLYASLTTIVARVAPEHRTSEVLGMLTVLRTIANAIGIVWVFHLLSISTVPAPDGRGEFRAQSSYLLTMGYIAAGSLINLFLYLGFYRARSTESAVDVGPVAK